MDYNQYAKKLAAQGRNGDTMLMHVSPKEVAGLNYLGGKYGTKVTFNPKTGLPEAFNFNRFLPMIAGAALAPYTGGMSAALLVGGAETARTGSLMKGFQAGLGAFGGANLATSVGTMGAEAGVADATAANLANPTMAVPTTNPVLAPPTEIVTNPTYGPITTVPQAAIQPIGVAPPTGAEVLNAQQPGQLEGFLSKQAGGAQFTDPSLSSTPLTPEQLSANQQYAAAGERYATAQTNAMANAPSGYGTPDFKPTYADMQRGFQRLGTTEGIEAAGSKIMSSPMAAAQTAGSVLLGSQEEQKPYEKEKVDYSKYPQAEPYKRIYRENPNPLKDEEFKYYDPNALYVKDGGQTRFNVGGLAGNYTDYMQQLQQMINRKGMSNPSPPTQSGMAMQAMNTGNRPQDMNKMRGYNKGGLEDGGFVLRASTVNGVGNGDTESGLQFLKQKLGAMPIRGAGDGMSDSIPTSIEGRRKALVSNGEAYVPRSQVAAIGNGDVNRGAKELDAFMKRVDKARTGKAAPPRKVNPHKLAPKKKTNA